MRILFFYSHLPQKTINTMEKTEELESDLDKDKEEDGENSLLTGETEFISKPG